MLESGVKGWRHWLQGAILIIENRNKLEDDIIQGNRWSTFSKIVVAMETMASVTSDYPLSLSQKYWDAFLRKPGGNCKSRLSDAKRIQERCSEDDFFEKLVGCPTVVFYVLAEISAYLQSTRTADPAEQASLDSSRHFHCWEDLLIRWSPSNQSQGASIHVTEAYRFAALVHSSRSIRNLPYTHSIVQGHVSSTLHHLSCLDDKDYSVIATWPLMVASLELDDEKAPETASALLRQIRGGITSVRKDTVFENLGNLVSLVWKRRREARTWEQKIAVSWRDISAEQGWEWCFW